MFSVSINYIYITSYNSNFPFRIIQENIHLLLKTIRLLLNHQHTIA